tara:strand:+ start:21 stop:293 length:273 start_codon:yes stop_codon:yes gene_type:complete
MSERIEALMRILVLIVTGIIMGIWKILIQVLSVIHWLIVIITGKRNKDIAQFCEIWTTQLYTFIKYLTFVSNKRPFPFSKLEKNMSKFGK